MFGDPEFFDINTSKQMGMWPAPNQMSTSIIPYIKRMRIDKPSVFFYGVLKGDDLIDILEKTNVIAFGYDKFKPDIDGQPYVETRKKNIKDFDSICRGRYNTIDDPLKYMKYFDVVLVNMHENLDYNLKDAYDTVKSNGIFAGNFHDVDRVKASLGEFRRNNKIGTPISIANKTVWFWYKR